MGRGGGVDERGMWGGKKKKRRRIMRVWEGIGDGEIKGRREGEGRGVVRWLRGRGVRG